MLLFEIGAIFCSLADVFLYLLISEEIAATTQSLQRSQTIKDATSQLREDIVRFNSFFPHSKLITNH